MKHKTLWNKESPFYPLSKSLSDRLVPMMGPANSETGELLRHLGNFYYDFYNNGGCNLDAGRKDSYEALLANRDDIKAAMKEPELFDLLFNELKKCFETTEEEEEECFECRGDGYEECLVCEGSGNVKSEAIGYPAQRIRRWKKPLEAVAEAVILLVARITVEAALAP